MRKRILVADASETIVAVCRKLLAQQGYDTTLFQDGTRALEELKHADYDLAVIATTTQNVNGYFIVKELRKDRAKAATPVLMLLGSSELLDTKELVDVAPDDTLSKPFSPQELLDKIARLLSQGKREGSGEDEEELDIESILSDDAKSFEKKISDATDKIFLGVLSQPAGESDSSEKARLDKLELTEDQYDIDASIPEVRPETNVPHDYNWFISEMRTEASPPEPEVEPPRKADGSGKFQIEEVGTSKIPLDRLRKMQSSAEIEKTRVYFEKLNEPVNSSEYDSAQLKETGPLDLKERFVKSFAESLAKEIAKQIDFEKLAARIESETRKLAKH